MLIIQLLDKEQGEEQDRRSFKFTWSSFFYQVYWSPSVFTHKFNADTSSNVGWETGQLCVGRSVEGSSSSDIRLVWKDSFTRSGPHTSLMVWRHAAKVFVSSVWLSISWFVVCLPLGRCFSPRPLLIFLKVILHTKTSCRNFETWWTKMLHHLKALLIVW